MEIGFVKQSFNNEIIKMKQSFLRAKVQTINKLTKKSKALKEKCAKSDDTKGKTLSKAEQSLNEVFIMKKLKARDVAEFILRNDKNIQHFLNSSVATKEKAISRLVTHKSLVDKAISIKEKFLNMPVDILLAPGKRQILKQEKVKSAPVTKKKPSNKKRPRMLSTNSLKVEWTITENLIDPETKKMLNDLKVADSKLGKGSKQTVKKVSVNKKVSIDNKKDSSSKVETVINVGMETSEKKDVSVVTSTKSAVKKIKKNVLPKQTQKVRAKKLKVKVPFLEEDFKPEPAGVDAFFVTDSGDNYETLVDKRVQEPLPESTVVKGNRKMRRAAIFGRPLPFTPSKNRNVDNGKLSKKPDNSQPNRVKQSVKLKKHFNSRTDIGPKLNEDISSLHPSWQAKKQQSNILEFKGKKVTFDD